jgi:hypothetical protein
MILRAASVASTLSVIVVWAKTAEALAQKSSMVMAQIRMGFMSLLKQEVREIDKSARCVRQVKLLPDLELADPKLK